ncbi:hypothetical protein C0992_011309, partial [Termitomyces sp. T32_za158]
FAPEPTLHRDYHIVPHNPPCFATKTPGIPLDFVSQAKELVYLATSCPHCKAPLWKKPLLSAEPNKFEQEF